MSDGSGLAPRAFVRCCVGSVSVFGEGGIGITYTDQGLRRLGEVGSRLGCLLAAGYCDSQIVGQTKATDIHTLAQARSPAS